MSVRGGRLAGRVALVTGAASGIGAATARRFAAEGATVILADRDRVGLDRTNTDLTQEQGGATAVIDQTDPESVDELFAIAVAAHDRLDVAVLAAGYGQYCELLTVPIETWQRHLDVNLTGSFLVLRATASRMAECGHGGSIVVVGSTASAFPTDLFGAYAAAKAGVLMLARTAAAELGSYRIRVNTIMPGVIHTPMTDSILADHPTRELVCRETPLGRPGSAEDVAAAAAFLASDDAAFITGTSLLVDGGQTLHGFPRWFGTDYRVEGPPTWVAQAHR